MNLCPGSENGCSERVSTSCLASLASPAISEIKIENESFIDPCDVKYIKDNFDNKNIILI